MKSFIAALVLLALAVAVTVGNAMLLEKRFGVMNDMASSLSEEPSDANAIVLEKLQDYLKKNGKYMALTVRSSVLKSLDELMTVAKMCAEEGNAEGYKSALETLQKQLKTAKNAEKASFGNFF